MALERRADCRKSDGHKGFIPIKQLTRTHFPQDRRDPWRVDYIRAAADLVVKLYVYFKSKDRPKGYSCYNYRGRMILSIGSGFVIGLIKCGQGGELNQGETCVCIECSADGSVPRHVWWKLLVNTAAHVVFDETEVANTSIKFFYDDKGDLPVVCGGHELVGSNIKDDICVFTAITHDENLVERLEKALRTMIDLRRSPDRAEGRDPVVVISFPHGLSKHVSVGEMLGESRRGKSSSISYSASACPGSGGGLVLTGHKDHWKDGVCYQIQVFSHFRAAGRRNSKYMNASGYSRPRPTFHTEGSTLHENFLLCTKNPGHLYFIPALSLRIYHLPQSFRDPWRMEMIKAKCDLTVRIRSRTTDTEVFQTGTGYVVSIEKIDDALDRQTCVCLVCPGSVQPIIWRVKVRTAAHVVGLNTEMIDTSVWLFYDYPGCKHVVAVGHRLLRADHQNDASEFECLLYDEEAGKRLDRALTSFLRCAANHPALQIDPVITIGHPHGKTKYVTIGRALDQIQAPGGLPAIKHTASSCPGDSGAPTIATRKVESNQDGSVAATLQQCVYPHSRGRIDEHGKPVGQSAGFLDGLTARFKVQGFYSKGNSHCM